MPPTIPCGASSPGVRLPGNPGKQKWRPPGAVPSGRCLPLSRAGHRPEPSGFCRTQKKSGSLAGLLFPWGRDRNVLSTKPPPTCSSSSFTARRSRTRTERNTRARARPRARAKGNPRSPQSPRCRIWRCALPPPPRPLSLLQVSRPAPPAAAPGPRAPPQPSGSRRPGRLSPAAPRLLLLSSRSLAVCLHLFPRVSCFGPQHMGCLTSQVSQRPDEKVPTYLYGE